MGMVTVLQFITLAVLARLLSPADFGLMGMTMVVISFAQAFADMGLSNAIIQRQDVEEDHLSSFFWINAFSGIVLFACVLLFRPIVILYFKQPSLSNYLLFAAFIFLITPVGQIFTALLRKQLKFKILSKIEIACTTVYSVTAIGFALAKFGVLSLIFGQLVQSLFALIIYFIIFRKTWLPRFHLSIKEIKSYFSFGFFQMGERVVNYIRANIDYIIIGRFLGPEALGFYTLAYQIITFPMSKINPIITRVAFPVFSKVQHDNDLMRKGYCKVISFLSMISFPLLAGMFVIATEFITLVYGAKWEPSIIIVQIFCLVGMIWSLCDPIGSVLLSKGRADIGFYWNIFAAIVSALAIIAGVNWGIKGVALAILSLQIPFFFIIQPIVNKLIDLKLSEYFKAIKIPFFCTVVMFAVIFFLRLIINDLKAFPLLVIIVFTGMIIYASLYYRYYSKNQELFTELKSLLKGN